MGCELTWQNIWQDIFGAGLSTNWESEITWRIAHGVVKTRAYLKSWRQFAVIDQCAGCGERETISHAFCSSRLVSPVWSWMSNLINQFSESIILLRQGLPQGSSWAHSNAITSFLIKLTLNELWAARNLDTFESKRPSAQTIISKIKTRIRQRIKAAFHITPHAILTTFWAYRNVLCSFANQQLIIKI